MPDLIDTNKAIWKCEDQPRLKTEYNKIRKCFGGASVGNTGVSVSEAKDCEYSRDELDDIYNEYFYKKKHCNIE
jgi:hypothetical protein